MSNCNQTNNTTIKGTSAFIYDSTPLTCTDVNTCDGLNTILSKFDAIICDVTTDVNTLIEDVPTLTEEVVIATEDIIDIYARLNICCPTTTTTTTLPITTTTSTSSSTTTTTTTVAPPCDCFQIFANDGDHVFYVDCNGVSHTEIFEGIPSTVPPNIGLNSKLYCVRSVRVEEPYFIVNTGIYELGSYCDPTTTTSTSSSTSTSTSTSSTSTTTSSTSTSSSTTTTTTTAEVSSYYFENFDVFYCGECAEPFGIGAIYNAYPLPINKWYQGFGGGDGMFYITDVGIPSGVDPGSFILPDSGVDNCVDVICPTTTTTTTLPIVTCGTVLANGTTGYTDAIINLDPSGGVVTVLFYTGQAPDKLEIYHGPPLVGGTNRKATSSMTSLTNDGVYDDLYGVETLNDIPTLAEAMAVTQFIGTIDGRVIPTRQTQYTAATSLAFGSPGYIIPTPMSFTNPTTPGAAYQQVVWWIYTPAHYSENQTVTIRITGAEASGWAVYRWCPPA